MVQKVRTLIIIVSSLLIGPLFAWEMFGYNDMRGKYANIKLRDIKLLWTFMPDKRIRKYRDGMSVWSRNIVGGIINNRFMLFCGSYDHNVYAIDMENGREVWRFTTGDYIDASPLLFKYKNRDYLAVVSHDRAVYLLNPIDGSKVWVYQVYPWNFSISDLKTTTPIFFNGKLYIFSWFVDRGVFRINQRGELLCLDANTGRLLFRKNISDSPMFDAAFIRDKGLFVITSSNGRVMGIDLKGNIVWDFVASQAITTGAVVVRRNNRYYAIFGCQYGLLFKLDAISGKKLGYYKLGMQLADGGIVSPDNNTIIIPDYDRHIYAVDINTMRPKWMFKTGKNNQSPGCGLIFNGQTAVAIPSQDNNLYILSLMSGELLFSYKLGKRIWAFETRGGTIWPGPSVFPYKHRGYLILPWYDNRIYCFISKGKDIYRDN